MEAREVPHAAWRLACHADIDERALDLSRKGLVRRPQAVQALVEACTGGQTRDGEHGENRIVLVARLEVTIYPCHRIHARTPMLRGRPFPLPSRIQKDDGHISPVGRVWTPHDPANSSGKEPGG